MGAPPHRRCCATETESVFCSRSGRTSSASSRRGSRGHKTMETQELEELGEKVHNTVERKIGLTMAVVAALLATVTLMGHRLHTEEVVAQTKAADQWAYYQAKNGRYHMYAADAKLA